MSILNKNNYGYISPSDFNLYAKQAQLDLFEQYFNQYNYQIQKEAARQSGTEYADLTKGIAEVIDTFSVTRPLLKSNSNKYFLPSLLTTNDNYHLINKVLINKDPLVLNSTTTEVGGGDDTLLEDSSQDFLLLNISPGDLVYFVSGGIVQSTVVVSIIDETQLTVEPITGVDMFTTIGQSYSIFEPDEIKEAERVSHSKITMLNNSIYTSPKLMFPAYTQEADLMTLYPKEISGIGQVTCQYIRFPKDPKWTYVEFANGEPSFNASALDYQDFELPLDDEVNLVNKILQYSGMSIREIEMVQLAQAKEMQSVQEEK